MSNKTCIICNRPLTSEEYSHKVLVPIGPECRGNTLTGLLGIDGNKLTPAESLDKTATYLKGEFKDLAPEFLKSEEVDPVRFFIDINSLRQKCGVSELVSPNYKELKLLELEHIKKESKKYGPSFRKLIEMGFTPDEVRYSKDFDQMVKKYLMRNPDSKFPLSQEEMTKTYFEALDYLDRYDRMALIKIETSTPEQNYKLAEKRVKDHNLMTSVGFSESDILNHKALVEKLENDPKVQAKAYKLLQATGRQKSPPKDDNSLSKALKDDYRFLKATFKSAFWASVLVMDIACKASEITGIKTSKKKPFKTLKRQKPSKVLKDWYNYKNGEAKHSPSRELIKEVVAKDYQIVDIEKRFKEIKKKKT